MTKNADLKKLVTKAAVQRVPLDAIGVDPSYQRDVKPKHKKIIAEFNETAFGIPLVAEREDRTLWIVDGLQRMTAAKKMGWVLLRAEVFASSGPEHEAQVFKFVNLYRTKLEPLDEWRALLTSHDETAWEIKRVVEGCGFRISGDGKNPDTLRCVSSIRTLHKRYGSEGLKFSLEVSKKAWPGEFMTHNSSVLMGLGSFYRQNDGEVDKSILLPKLSKVTPQKLLYSARQSSLTNDVYGEIAKLVQQLYMKRRGRPRKNPETES